MGDDKQWDIYDNGEKPPHRSPSPIVTLKTKTNLFVAPMNLPVPPKRPKRPAPSFAFFLGDALKEWKKDSSNDPNIKSCERTKIIAQRWSVMTDEDKQKYKDKHYNNLGIERHGKREKKACDEVLVLLKQKMGNAGRFFKGSLDKYYQVDDVAAREKIIADIRRRVHTAKMWLKGEESENSLASRKPAPTLPVCPTRMNSAKTKSLELGGNDVVLSLLNEKYKNIMWSHFRKLGRAHGEEEEFGRKIFLTLKKGLGKGGAFFKKPFHGKNLLQINDEVALQKVTQDLKRRMESSAKWLMSGPSAEKKPRLSPTRKARQSRQQQKSKVVAETTSRYPRRGSQPEPSSPLKDSEEIPSVQEKRRLSPTRKAEHSRQQRASKALPETKPHLSPSRYSQRGSQLESTVSKDDTVKFQPPLAPIFLKKYGKQKKQGAPEAISKKKRKRLEGTQSEKGNKSRMIVTLFLMMLRPVMCWNLGRRESRLKGEILVGSLLRKYVVDIILNS